MSNKIGKFNIKLIVVVLTIVCTLALTIMQHSDDEEALIDKYNSLTAGQGGTTNVASVAKSIQQAQNQTVPGLNNVASSDWCEFFQGNYSETYGNEGKKIARCGCGLCSTCVVAEHFTGNTKKYLPNTMNHEVVDGTKGAYQSQHAITNFFSKHTEIPVTCSLKQSRAIDTKMLDDLLAKGGCLIVDYGSTVTYNGSCVWTGKGHYIVVCGGNSTDGYEVRDSNGGHNTGTRGIAAWAPYNKHKFPKQYITTCKYYYIITPK